VELELAVVEWAIRKCRLYLSVQYTLDAIENPKIQRLKERLASYSFHTVWRKRKDHIIPDALSRALVNDPGKDDECIGEELAYSIKSVIIQRIFAICSLVEESPSSEHLPDIMLRELRTAAEADYQYKDLVNAVKSGFRGNKAHVADHVRQFWAISHQ
jgi:hypothetical protein